MASRTPRQPEVTGEATEFSYRTALCGTTSSKTIEKTIRSEGPQSMDTAPHPNGTAHEGAAGAEMVRQGQEEGDEVSEERAAAFMARALSKSTVCTIPFGAQSSTLRRINQCKRLS